MLSSEHLADETAAPGSQRGTDGHFFLARRRAGHEQVREIGTHDQHHYADRAGQHNQRGADTAAHVFFAG
jgi:hypothetical protein